MLFQIAALSYFFRSKLVLTKSKACNSIGLDSLDTLQSDFPTSLNNFNSLATCNPIFL